MQSNRPIPECSAPVSGQKNLSKRNSSGMQEPQKKKVDTTELVSALKELVEAGHEVSLTISGRSMTPFLAHERDRIFFSTPNPPLRRGDMVFFRRTNGQYVMHRICKVRPEGCYLVGDGQTEVEGPILPGQIFARVNRVERKGKILTERDFWWRFFAGPWLWLRPLRPTLCRVYGMVKKLRK